MESGGRFAGRSPDACGLLLSSSGDGGGCDGRDRCSLCTECGARAGYPRRVLLCERNLHGVSQFGVRQSKWDMARGEHLVYAECLSTAARGVLFHGWRVCVCGAGGVCVATWDVSGERHDLRRADMPAATRADWWKRRRWGRASTRAAGAADRGVLPAGSDVHRDDRGGLHDTKWKLSGAGAAVFSGVLPGRVATGGVLLRGWFVRDDDGD